MSSQAIWGDLTERLANELDSGAVSLDTAPTPPSIPVVKDDLESLGKAVRAIKQVVETLSGISGNAWDIALTPRLVVTEGITSFNTGSGFSGTGSGGGGTVIVPPNPGTPPGYVDPRPVLVTPPTPTNLEAFGAFRTIILTWDLFDYQNHAFTEIWRSTTNNLATATLLNTARGDLYSDASGTVGETFYYWVRAVNIEGTAGAYNSSVGTVGALEVIGGTDLGPLIVEAGNLAVGSVGPTKISDNAIQAQHISANSIAVGSAAIANGAIRRALIEIAAIDSARIADAAIITAKIGDAQITNAKIDRVTANKLQVVSADISDLAVTNAKIGNGEITSAKIGTAEIKNVNIENGSVSNAKIGTYIASTNYNGTIDGGGNIVAYGTIGWAISKSGTMDIRTGVFQSTNTGKRIAINEDGTNEARFYGDRGDGTVEQLINLGVKNVGSDWYIAEFGSVNSLRVAVAAYSKTTSGVIGSSVSGTGVDGFSTSGTGVFGDSSSGAGVVGVTRSTTNAGVAGNDNSGGTASKGVYGGTSYGAGVLGSASQTGDGVWGFSQGGKGVRGTSVSGYAGHFTGNATKPPLFIGTYSSAPSDVTVGGLALIQGPFGYYELCTPNAGTWVRLRDLQPWNAV
jgi:hypothetical protein